MTSQQPYARVRPYFTKFGLSTLGLFQGTDSAYADYCENCQSQFDEGLEKRHGYQVKAKSVGGYGLINYSYVDFENTLIEETLLIDTSLYRLKTGTLNITYTGTSPRAVVRCLLDSGQFKLFIYVAGALVTTQNLGAGYQEASSVTMTALASAIDALADFTASVTGTGTVSAAFLDITEELSIPPNYSKTINFNYTEEVDIFVDYPLDGLKLRLETDDVTNVPWVNHEGLIVLTDGTKPKVYDGGALYIAGMPQPAIPYIETISAGKYDDYYTYYTTYEYTDFQGRITTSSFSEGKEILLNNKTAVLKLATLTEESGYNTKSARINGAQTVSATAGRVTLTVDSGHTLKRGDFATFLDSKGLCNYTITAVTSTTLTLKCDVALTVADNNIISNGLKINLYRQKKASTSRQLIKSLPNDPTLNYLTYTDALRYATVDGTQSVEPVDGLVQLLVDSDNTLLDGDIITANDKGDTLTVVTSLGTLLTVKSTSPVSSEDEVFLSLNELTFPTYVGDVLQRRDPPPDSEYCCSYRGSLVLAKHLFIYWSDGSNAFVTTSGLSFNYSNFIGSFERPINGMAASADSLIVFQDSKIDNYITKSLEAGDIAEYNISRKLGALGHHAIAALGNKIWFASRAGVHELTNGLLSLQGQQGANGQLSASTGLGPTISDSIASFFLEERGYIWKRAVMVADPKTNMLILTLPKETEGSSGWSYDVDTFIYEIAFHRWYLWKNLGIEGGAILDSQTNFYFCTRRLKDTRIPLCKLLMRRNDTHGYSDHTSAISMVYETKYDTLEPPLEQKLLTDLKVYSVKRDTISKTHSPTVDVTIVKDYVDIAHSTLNYTFESPPDSMSWGLNWDVDGFGSWPSPFEKRTPSQESVEAFKLRFTNSQVSTNCKLTGWTIKYTPRPGLLRQ